MGLPVALAFGRHLPVIGFDTDRRRVEELRAGHDWTGEASQAALKACPVHFTDDPLLLKEADLTIVAVPTPVDKAKRPDLSSLISASRMVGQALALRRREMEEGSHPPIVVYESTVYPGCTEEVCVPELERESGLKAGRDFKVGYSPERVNPGDPQHSLGKVVKVVSAQDTKALEEVARAYSMVTEAGVYRAPDIRTAEAAKVIENVQRDLNIALANELAMLFHRLGLNTKEVFQAAGTKWNFLPFEPGLVGGHCIPVDPYYLTDKAEEMGYHPVLILAGRRLNDGMGPYVAGETVKLLIRAGRAVRGGRVLVLGLAFKENVRDVRNSQVPDLVRELESHELEVDVYDPLVEDAPGDRALLGLHLVPDPFGDGLRDDGAGYDAVVLAVPHQVLVAKGPEAYLALIRPGPKPGVLVDVKGVMLLQEHPGVLYWRL